MKYEEFTLYTKMRSLHHGMYVFSFCQDDLSKRDHLSEPKTVNISSKQGSPKADIKKKQAHRGFEHGWPLSILPRAFLILRGLDF